MQDLKTQGYLQGPTMKKNEEILIIDPNINTVTEIDPVIIEKTPLKKWIEQGEYQGAWSFRAYRALRENEKGFWVVGIFTSEHGYCAEGHIEKFETSLAGYEFPSEEE